MCRYLILNFSFLIGFSSAAYVLRFSPECEADLERPSWLQTVMLLLQLSVSSTRQQEIEGKWDHGWI